MIIIKVYHVVSHSRSLSFIRRVLANLQSYLIALASPAETMADLSGRGARLRDTRRAVPSNGVSMCMCSDRDVEQ